MNNDFINQDIQDIIIERDGYKEQVEEKYKEIDRLNNIISELERFLNYEIYCDFNKKMTKGYQDTLDKLKELKEKE